MEIGISPTCSFSMLWTIAKNVAYNPRSRIFTIITNRPNGVYILSRIILQYITLKTYDKTLFTATGHGNADDVIEPANCPVETEATRPDYNGIPIFLLLTRPEPETTNTATSI